MMKDGILRPEKFTPTEKDQFPKLKEIPFFALFDNEQDLISLGEAGNWLKIPCGTMFIHEGALEDSIFVLIQGQARVFKGDKTLDMLEAGDMFGEMGALLNEPRSANVKATTDCYIFEFSEAILRTLSPNTVFLVMRYIFRLTAKRLIATNRKLITI